MKNKINLFKSSNNRNKEIDNINNIATKDEELLRTYNEEDLDEENISELETSADEIIDLDEENENKLYYNREKNPQKYKSRLLKKQKTTRENIIVEDNLQDSNINSDKNIEEKTDTDYENDDYDEDNRKKRKKKPVKILNIMFIMISIIIVMIGVDYICVENYNKGPFFAIPIHTYKDGGSKEYIGLGYKVIKYNQIQGRKDKIIGTWALKYNTTPLTIEDLDLSIEFNKNKTKTYNKYNKKFLRIISTLENIDTDNNLITIGYVDEGKKYSLDIVCQMANKDSNISNLKVNSKITVIGTVSGYDYKTKNTVATLYLSNCFAEQ